MNLFNCFQAVAFYTIAPFFIHWLYTNDHTTWAYILGFGEFVGFIMMSVAINTSKFLKEL